MDKTKETKNSTTLNSTINGNQQHSINTNTTTTTTNSDSGTSNNINNTMNSNNRNGIGDLSPSTSTTTSPLPSSSTSIQKTNNNNNDNNKINLGCGSIIRQQSPQKTTTRFINNNSNKNLINNSTSPIQNNSSCSSSSSLSSSPQTISSSTTSANAVKPLARTAISASSFAMNSSAVATTTSSSSTTNINNLQTSITQFGTPLPSSLQHQANLANLINLNINTTTGGNFGVTVDPSISVENLKKIVAKKLKVAKDRICLLHREKELQDGTLKDNNLMDGSRIILIPNVETGLLAQRSENTVMQALESLNESQVNDFLSGKTPLNLSMRLGDHMMLIQLQLSTVNPANNPNAAHHHAGHGHGHGVNCTSRLRSSQRGVNRSSLSANGHQHHQPYPPPTHHHSQAQNSGNRNCPAPSPPNPTTAGSSSNPNGTNGATAISQPIIKLRQSLPATSGRGNPLPAATSRLNKTNNGGEVGATSGAATKTSNINTNINSNSTLPISTDQQQPQPGGSNSNNYIVPPRNPYKRSFGAALTASEYENLHKIAQSIAGHLPSRNIASRTNPNLTSSSAPAATSNTFHSVTPPNDATLLEQSPIKSLSNLVSSPIKTTAIKDIPIASTHTSVHSSSLLASNNTNNSSTSSALAVKPTSISTTTPTPTTSIPTNVATSSAGSSPGSCQPDPIAAKLTSCLCTRLNSGSSHLSTKQCVETSCLSRQDSNLKLQQNQPGLQPQRSVMLTSTPNIKNPLNSEKTGQAINSAATATLHKTANNPISRPKHRHHHNHHHHPQQHHYPQQHTQTTQPGPMTTSTSALRPIVGSANPKLPHSASRFSTNSNDSGFVSDDSMNASTSQAAAASASASATSLPASTMIAATNPTALPASSASALMEYEESNNVTMTTDTRTLAEASRNLTQTLRKLSKEVFTNKIDLSACNEEAAAARRSSGGGSVGGTGAVIESMKNHGKGIYSGTFSGTLNPALQDRYGRPKRDISTVIHILNDLLSATPQYSRGARISLETPASTASTASAASSSTTSTSTNFPMDSTNSHPNSRSKQLSSKHHSHHCLKLYKDANRSVQNVGTANGSSSSSSSCSYGECNGHYANSKSLARPSPYPCCSDVTMGSSALTPANGHTNPNHNITANSMEKNVCTCRYKVQSETGEKEREYTCQKCSHDMDNLKTKSKMNQIRLVMQQSKQKREARKLKGAPYGTRVSNGLTETACPNNTTDLSSNDAEMLPASGENTNTKSSTALNNATAATTLATAAASASTTEVSPNHLVEEVDTAA